MHSALTIILGRCPLSNRVLIFTTPLTSFSLSAKIVYQGVALGARRERDLGDEW